MSLITQNYTFTINGSLIFGLILFILFSQLIVFIYIHSLSKKLKKYEEPRFGFMGKPLYPLIGVVLMVIGLASYNYFRQDQDIVYIQASKTIETSINVEQLQSVGNNVKTKIAAVPTVEGQPWGRAGDTFDLFWKIEGPTLASFTEYNRSKTNISSIVANLQKGEYTITLTVVYDDKAYVFKEYMVI